MQGFAHVQEIQPTKADDAKWKHALDMITTQEEWKKLATDILTYFEAQRKFQGCMAPLD
jgi:hypothetical protein